MMRDVLGETPADSGELAEAARREILGETADAGRATPTWQHQRSAIATTAALGVLVLVAVLLAFLAWGSERQGTAARHNRAVADAATAVLTDLLKARNAEYFSLLTGAGPDASAEPTRDLSARLAALRDLTSADAGQAALARDAADAIGPGIGPPPPAQHDEAARRAAAGATAFQRASEPLGRLQEEAARRVRDAAAARDTFARWSFTISCALAAGLLLLAVFLIRDVRRSSRLLLRREHSLRQLAMTLERRVVQRTRSLSEVNRRFAAALRASGVAVFTQDAGLLYTWASKPALGLPIADVVGRGDADLMPSSAHLPLTEMKRQVLATGEPGRAEIFLDDDGHRRWFEVTVDTQSAPDGSDQGLIGGVIDITDRKETESRIRLLVREVTHRSKNLLAVIQAIARQTAPNSLSIEDFINRFEARVQSLAGSHDLLVRGDWNGAWMRDLVRSQLGHYSDRIGSQIELEGPRMRVQPQAAQHIGMALHELATNAAKYGALSVPQGRVRIAWSLDTHPDGERWCALSWQEEDGPEVAPPGRHGFGRVVTERVVARAVNGEANITFLPRGVRWTLTFPAREMVEESAFANS